MFSSTAHTHRRRQLYESDRLRGGLVLLLGNEQSAMNYADNPYPFRQDSTFLYYVGIDAPGMDVVLDLDAGTGCLYADDHSLDDVVWMGEHPTREDYAEASGLPATADRDTLQMDLEEAIAAGRPVHFLPPYRAEHRLRLARLLGLQPERVSSYVSTPLKTHVAAQRSQKSPEEVEQLEQALDATAEMHMHAMQRAHPGVTERTIAGEIAGIADAQGRGLSFRPTCSVHGDVLHNHSYENTLQDGDLFLVDAGASSPHYYAGDITRVAPVGGFFTPRQEDLYTAVLDAQVSAIQAIEPGRPFLEIHLHACQVLAERLIDIGLMKGSAEAAVDAGAHALFFPHGLGHMLGLDTHDMENFGEDIVGYAPDQQRSDQFGLHTLRLARPLEPGFVVTVEPGCYFIPALIDQWNAENRHAEFIDYTAVDDFVGLGGIRIEDDVLVTKDEPRVLGPGIPKDVDAVEAQVSAA